MAATSTTTTTINHNAMMEAVPSQSSSSSATTTPSAANAVVDTRQQHDGMTSDFCNGKSIGSDGSNRMGNGSHVPDDVNGNHNNAENDGPVSALSIPPSQGSNSTDIASKADRLKELELIESYILGVQPPVTLNAKSTNNSEYQNGFSTMEILHEHLLQSNFRSDDERLLNQIIQPSEAILTTDKSNKTMWDQASLQRQASGGFNKIDFDYRYSALGNIYDQTTMATLSNRPRLLSSLSRQSSMTVMENCSHGFDASNIDSTAWKPEFQKDHQEIPYSPAHIFSERYNGAVSTTAATNIIDATASLSALPPSILPSAKSTTDISPQRTDTHVVVEGTTAAGDHTAGAETLLLAAKVLYEGTSHSNHNDNPTPTRQKTRPPEAATTVDTKSNDEGVSPDQSRTSRNFKNQDVASSEQHDSMRNRDVPEGHAIVEEGRIALLIPDADITSNDVLLGRGGRTNHHIGNTTYRTYKESLQDDYLRATKDEKTSLSNRLVQMIHQRQGRFLKAYEPTKDQSMKTSNSQDYRSDSMGVVEFWYEVDLSTARKKASQALREINTPENRAAKRAKYSSSTTGSK